MRRLLERARRRAVSSDAGFGLTEVAVAMIVLGIIMVGMFPLVVDSVLLAQKNAEVAQANRIVATELDTARASLGRSCVDADDPARESTDLVLGEDEALKFSGTLEISCVASRLAKVTVTVERTAEPGRDVASATTNILTS